MAKIDEKINKYKNKNLLFMTTPCSVFMTFETEEGLNRALKFDEAIQADESLSHLSDWLGNHKIEI